MTDESRTHEDRSDAAPPPGAPPDELTAASALRAKDAAASPPPPATDDADDLPGTPNAPGGGDDAPSEPPPEAAPPGARAGRRPRALVAVEEGPPTNLFIYPLGAPVLVPGLATPLPVTSERGQSIVDQVLSQGRFLGFVARRDTTEQTEHSVEAAAADLHEVGVVARVIEKVDMPDGGYAVLVQVLSRFRITRWARKQPFLIAKVAYLDETWEDADSIEALASEVRTVVAQILALLPPEVEHFDPEELRAFAPPRLADFVAANIGASAADRQRVLEHADVEQRLRIVLELVLRELHTRQLGARIRQEIQKQAEEHQKKWVLQEQLKAIKRELGEEKEEDAAATWEAKVEAAHMPAEAAARAREELERLDGIPTESPEHNVLRTWLEWMCALPWDRTSEEHIDLDAARRVLDDDHHGLGRVKERIEEVLAVRKLRPTLKGPILCFVGPPGVGKTSLGKSIARALGREVYRFSVGGMRDEAEIKGHRRTYVGAMPGKILQGLRRVGTRNPVFVLDELDKLASDWRGDPASALLEVLDPAQNAEFLDHYLDVRFDLSQVLFIATANVTETIPPALLDRMEVIHLSSYIEDEKVEIAARHLLPRQREENGLTPAQVQLPRPVLSEIIRGWTREGGVRNLEREIARICRKTAAAVVRGAPRPARVTTQRLDDLLGPRRFDSEHEMRPPRPGTAVGLAWTPHGGEILHIECASMKGSGTLTLTGHLGEVMSESGRAAMTWVRSHVRELGLDEDSLRERDLHVHFPAGAIPKDGPSAGVTIATALVSLLRPEAALRPGVAMTGEITLTGRVLPVGGIREKVIAARTAGMTRVILPSDNAKDLVEIPDKVRAGLDIVLARDVIDVLAAAFTRSPLESRKKKGKRT